VAESDEEKDYGIKSPNNSIFKVKKKRPNQLHIVNVGRSKTIDGSFSPIIKNNKFILR